MRENMTLLEFQERFGTEQNCIDHLLKARWPNGFVCPNCGHDVGYKIAHRQLMQCAVCLRQTSVTAGTIFHKTKLPLRIWFWMIYMIAQDKGGASALRLANQLGMHYSTVWHMVHKIRHAMARRDENVMLSGFIELDEAIFGPTARKTGRPRTVAQEVGKRPRKKRLGRGTQKTQTECVVLVEQDPSGAGNLAMRVISATTRADIREVVEQRVEPSQYFRTDAAQSHWVLRSMGHNLDAKRMSGIAGVKELPVVHRVIALAKRFLMGTFHGVSADRLQSYLDEFCFRFNRRHLKESLHQSLLYACISALPMSYAEVRR